MKQKIIGFVVFITLVLCIANIVLADVTYDGISSYRQGDADPMVQQIQNWLKTLGYYTGTVSGNFGNNTFNAVVAFQSEHNITNNGIANPNTIRAIQSAVSAFRIPIDEKNFSDPVFREYIRANIDTYSDGILTDWEIGAVKSISLGNNSICSLAGIEYFTNLEYLSCSEANLVCLDLNNNINLKSASISSNGRIIETEGNTYDLSLLDKTFNMSKAYDWKGATVDGNSLVVHSYKVTYRYDCGQGIVSLFTLLFNKPPIPEVIWPNEIYAGQDAYIRIKADNDTIRDMLIETYHVLENGAEEIIYSFNSNIGMEYDDGGEYVFSFCDPLGLLTQGEKYTIKIFNSCNVFQLIKGDPAQHTFTIMEPDDNPTVVPEFEIVNNVIIYPNLNSHEPLKLKFEKEITNKVLVDIEMLNQPDAMYHPYHRFIIDPNDPSYQNQVYQYNKHLDLGAYTVRTAYLGKNGNASNWTERKSFMALKGLDPPTPRMDIQQTWNAGQDITGRITNKVPKVRYLVNGRYEVDEEGYFTIPGHENIPRSLSVNVYSGYGYASKSFRQVAVIDILGNKKSIESIVANKQRAKLNEKVVFTVKAAGASKIRVKNAKIYSNSENKTFNSNYFPIYDYEFSASEDITNISLNALSNFQQNGLNKWTASFAAYIDGVWTDWYQADPIELYSEGVLSCPVYLGPTRINQGDNLVIYFSKVENATEYTVEVSDALFWEGDSTYIPGEKENHLFVEQVGSSTSYTFDSSLFNDQKYVYVNIIARAPGYVPSRSYQSAKIYINRNVNCCTISFDGNGSELGEMSQQIITSDSSSSTLLTPNKFSRTGYVFSGWNTKPDGSEDSYEDQADVSDLLHDGIASVTLYAQWTDVKNVVIKPILLKLENVPESLSGIFQSVDQIKKALLSKIIMRNGKVATNYELYDVVLMFSLNDGLTWIPATPSNFPQDGIKIVLPYPQCTGISTHVFKVAHMFTTDYRGRHSGEIETPPVTNIEQGIEVTFNGLSPVLLAWDEIGSHTDLTFEGSVKWLVSGEHPDHKLHLLKDGQKEHITIATKIDENTWLHRAEDLSYGANYYAVVDTIPGYYMEYQNVGEYADIKDKLYNGGTVLVFQIPPTGDKSNITRFIVLAIGMIVCFVSVKRCFH